MIKLYLFLQNLAGVLLISLGFYLIFWLAACFVMMEWMGFLSTPVDRIIFTVLFLWWGFTCLADPIYKIEGNAGND